LSPEFVAGLIKSGMDRDADGLIDADPSLEKSFFEASETDDVSDHAPCMFAVCSVTTGLSGVMVDLGSGAMRCDNKPYNNLAEVYGSFDEDETWVLGARAVQKEKQKGKTKPLFTRDFVRSIDWRAISEEAESQAMSDMRLTSYFEKVKNFTVIIDFSYQDDKNAGSNDLIKFLRVVINTDGEVADDDIVETVNDYVLDSYVMPAFQQHIESLGYDWSEFYENWLDVFPGPPGAGFNVNFENDIVIKPWKE
jgi:hypothetical protein